MELFTYLMAKNDHNTSVNKDLFSYLLGKNQSGTYTDYSGTSLSINNTKKGKMKVNLLGNTSQTGTPTPSSPIPVNVVSGDNTIVCTGKNLLNIDRTELSATSGSFDITDTTKCYNGMTRQDFKRGNNIIVTKNSNGSITLQTVNSYYGLAFPVRVEPNTEYTIAATIDDNAKFSFGIGFYDENGIYLDNASSWQEDLKSFTTPANCKIANICLCPTLGNTPVTISNIYL